MSTQQPRASMTPIRMRAALAASMLLAATAAVAPAAAGTSSPDEHGYWVRGPVVDADVDEGELVVAGQPEGALAVSALRFSVELDEQAASIHLTVTSDTREGFVEEPLLFACPAESDWEPEHGGDWDDKPGEHCSPGSAAEGELGEEEDEYVFVVSQFIQNGEVDVMITPGVRGAVPSPLLYQEMNDILIEQIGGGAPWPGVPTVDGADGSNFRVTFAAPDGDTVRTGEDSADESITALTFDGDHDFGGDFDEQDDGFGGDTDAGTTASPPDTSGPRSAPSSTPSGDGSGGSTSGPSPQPETAQPPQAADDPGDDSIQDAPPGGDQAESPIALEGDPQAGGIGDAEPAGALSADPRLLGALVLALGAIAAGMLAMNSPRSELGGLAQFARPRNGPPVRL